jgi:hypothetical protein
MHRNETVESLARRYPTPIALAAALIAGVVLARAARRG